MNTGSQLTLKLLMFITVENKDLFKEKQGKPNFDSPHAMKVY